MKCSKLFIYTENWFQLEQNMFASTRKIPYLYLLGTIKIFCNFKNGLMHTEGKLNCSEIAVQKFLEGKKQFTYKEVGNEDC